MGRGLVGEDVDHGASPGRHRPAIVVNPAKIRGGAEALLLGSHCPLADRRHRHGNVTHEEARCTTTADQGGSGALPERGWAVQ
jgi:hypothetical protein